MYFVFGNYRHDNNEVAIASISFTTERADNGPVVKIREQWVLAFEVFATNASALTLKLADIERAYRLGEGGVAAMFEDSGKPTVHILGVNSLGGCRLLDFSYPEGGKGEYVNSRKVQVTLEATRIAPGSLPILAFEEKLSFEGGGPIYAWRQPLNAPRYRQGPVGYDSYRAIQSGTAVGIGPGYPSAPSPIWPEWLIGTPLPGLVSPKLHGTSANPFFSDFAISWEYRFESTGPLSGVPHTYPGG